MHLLSKFVCDKLTSLISRSGPYKLNALSKSRVISVVANRGQRSASSCSVMEATDDPEKRLVWVDLELTGLEPELHKIVEICVAITDSDLNLVAESQNIVINYSPEQLENMSDWCKEMFPKLGLIEEIRTSTTDLRAAEKSVTRFVTEYVPRGRGVLAGNSVHMDRMFLHKHMPSFINHLHYRIVDVSSIKELARRWYPEILLHAPKKRLTHRALSDIEESIEELRWYRKNIFR